ncbi:MAG: hypothetical protein K0Q73_6094, partial [Paenibacillus sp.]|nr:hypothetical protein [Paenibacillus sp.]
MGILKTKRTKRKASLAIVICLLAQLVSPWSLGVDASVSTDLSTIGASTQNTNAQFAPIQLANVSSVIPSVYGGTELISRGFASSFQAGGNGQSQSPSISRDGRYLTFVSFASDLAEDAGTVSYSDMQVFLHDRLTGQTELVSYEFNKLNFPANGAFTRKPAISADGRYVVFESNASNLVPEDMLGHKDIFVWNRSTKEVKRVNVTSSGTEADSDSMNPTISAEGNYVLFQSDASNLKQPGVADNYVNTFRVEVATGSIKQINDPNGSPESPILSGNGQYAIYLHNGFIYVYDFNNSDPAYTPEKMEIQKTNPDPSVEVTYETPAISEDGRHIAYKVNEWKNDVFQNKYTEILDREGGNLQPVRIGIAFPYQEETISLSADGKSVVYPARSQDYPDLVPIDERKEVDLFVGRLDNGTLTVERATLPVGRGDSYFSPSISNSGVVAFSDYYDVFASYDRDAALEWPNGAAMTVVKNDQGNHVLNWPTINDASIRGYHIYQLDKFFGEFSDRRTLKGFVPPEASSFVVEGLDQSDLEPRFAVYAVNDTFNKSITPLITQYTVEDTLPPYWPNNVTSFRAEEVSTSSAVLKWNSAMDTSGRVASYKIWRLLNGTRIPLAETNFPFINLENLTPGQTYTLVMQASDEAGNWSPDTAPITFDTLLGGDQNVVLQAEYQHGMIALNWTAASHDKGVVSYSVFRKWGAGASTEIGKVNAPEHSYEDRHVQEGEPYIYQVKGYNAADQEVYATGSKAVSTGELQVPTLSYDVQLVDNHYLPVNGTLSLRATGQSNKAVTVTVSYRSWFDPNGIKLPIPRQFESKVNLQESSGELGAYIGAFTMPNGVSEISWLRADITSGGNVIKGNELAVNKLTAAALKVSFNLAHLNELTRGKLLSAIKGANANLSLNINGDTLTEDFQDFDQSFTFSNLSPDAYVSGVRLGDFFSVAGIGLQPGLTRQVVLSHIINNPTLKVVLKDSSGRPLSGMEVRYEEDGNELFRGYTDTNGQVQASLPPLSSGKVKVDVSYTKYMPVMGEPVEVSYGEVTKNITLNEYDFAPLSGKAVDHLG